VISFLTVRRWLNFCRVRDSFCIVPVFTKLPVCTAVAKWRSGSSAPRNRMVPLSGSQTEDSRNLSGQQAAERDSYPIG
jgi:hypothetical protein